MTPVTGDGVKEGNNLIAENYLIDRDGTVYSLRTNRTLVPSKRRNGYLQYNFCINGKQLTRLAHRLVAEKWIDNPLNLPEVNHMDGDKLNNDVLNLEWVTRSQNIQHGFNSGLITPPWKGKKGKLHLHSKAVYQCDGCGFPMKEFGSTGEAERETGIPSGHIQDVCRGKGVSAGGFKWKYK